MVLLAYAGVTAINSKQRKECSILAEMSTACLHGQSRFQSWIPSKRVVSGQPPEADWPIVNKASSAR